MNIELINDLLLPLFIIFLSSILVISVLFLIVYRKMKENMEDANKTQRMFIEKIDKMSLNIQNLSEMLSAKKNNISSNLKSNEVFSSTPISKNQYPSTSKDINYYRSPEEEDRETLTSSQDNLLFGTSAKILNPSDTLENMEKHFPNNKNHDALLNKIGSGTGDKESRINEVTLLENEILDALKRLEKTTNTAFSGDYDHDEQKN